MCKQARTNQTIKTTKKVSKNLLQRPGQSLFWPNAYAIALLIIPLDCNTTFPLCDSCISSDFVIIILSLPANFSPVCSVFCFKAASFLINLLRPFGRFMGQLKPSLWLCPIPVSCKLKKKHLWSKKKCFYRVGWPGRSELMIDDSLPPVHEGGIWRRPLFLVPRLPHSLVGLHHSTFK